MHRNDKTVLLQVKSEPLPDISAVVVEKHGCWCDSDRHESEDGDAPTIAELFEEIRCEKGD